MVTTILHVNPLISRYPDLPDLQLHHVTIKTVYKQWQPPFLSLVFYNVDRSTRSDRHSNVVFNSAFPANTSQLINLHCSTCYHLSSTIDHQIIRSINTSCNQSTYIMVWTFKLCQKVFLHFMYCIGMY